MFIKQLSVFVENKSGRLAEIAALLGDAQVDIRALSVADTTDFGILRLVVDNPDKAKEALNKAGLTVALTEVLGVGVSDVPGGFAKTMSVLAEAGVGVEYMYAFISREAGKAYLIMRVADNEKAITALKGSQLLTQEDIGLM